MDILLSVFRFLTVLLEIVVISYFLACCWKFDFLCMLLEVFVISNFYACRLKFHMLIYTCIYLDAFVWNSTVYVDHLVKNIGQVNVNEIHCMFLWLNEN